jgi:hypothetical protein
MGGGTVIPNPIRIFYFMILRTIKPFVVLISDDGLAYSGTIQPLFYRNELETIRDACKKAIEAYDMYGFDDERVYKDNEAAIEKEFKKLGGERQKKPDTFIYIMKDEINGFCKIGRSVNPELRERTLQSEKPSIKLIYKCKSFVSEENILHKKYNKYRFRGEWFRLTNEQIEEIKSYLESKYPVGQ